MKTACQTAKEVRAGQISAEDVLSEFLSRIKQQEPKIGAFLEIFEAEAAETARRIDKKRAEGAPLGLLAGVPVALKDNILFKGRECTCASKILKGHKAVYNATVTEKLLAADAIILGRTNMDEFAMGSSCENSAFQPTRNPADTRCVPGGSSGGSAAAVAAEMAPIALGSDTGGSIRQPASFCGVVGLKPTYGLVSRYGLVAFASSLDQIGPFTATAADCVLALSVIAGHDPKDSTSARESIGPYTAAPADMKNLKIGIPKEYFVSGMDKETESLVRKAIGKISDAGAAIKEISLPHTDYAMAAYYILASSEASSNLARFDGMRYGYTAPGEAGPIKETYDKSRGEGFGPEVKRRIMLGTYALSAGYYDAYYAKAQKVRTLIRKDFTDAFRQVDIIMTPTSPTPAFKAGEKISDPLAMYLSDIYTIPCNLAGIPGLSLPCGKTAAGLPVGLQLYADRFQEQKLLSAAIAAEALV